jgi:hypothetical protein
MVIAYSRPEGGTVILSSFIQILRDIEHGLEPLCGWPAGIGVYPPELTEYPLEKICPICMATLRSNHPTSRTSGAFVQFLPLLVLIAGILTFPFPGSTVLTVPPDLKPGDTYRLIFITSLTRDAAPTDIADYNTFVTRVASASRLGTLGATWKTIGSTRSIRAADNIGPSSAPIYRLDGTRIANSTDDLWDGAILAPVLFTESGISLPSPFVWTGTRTDGAISPFYLGSGHLVSVASPLSTNFEWVDKYPTAFFAQHHFYGISSVLTVRANVTTTPAFSAQLSWVPYFLSRGMSALSCGRHTAGQPDSYDIGCFPGRVSCINLF